MMLRARFPLGKTLALLACAAGLSACGGPSQRLSQARDLALSGHSRSALLEARAILLAIGDQRGDQDDVRRGALKLAGDLCALRLDDPRCAADEYRQLVQRYPTSPESFEARERLGDLFLRLGDVRGALTAWRDQVAAGPERPGAEEAQFKIARALVDGGAFEEARAAVTELAQRWPKSPLVAQGQLLSASTYHLEGRHFDAVRAYGKVAEQFRGTKDGADALFEQGNCLVEIGEDARALQAFTSALSRHESPDVVQFAMERSQRRLDRARPVRPNDRAAAFDHGVAQDKRATGVIEQ